MPKLFDAENGGAYDMGDSLVPSQRDMRRGYQMREMAAEILKEIETHLNIGLPSGCRLKREECLTLLRKLLARGTSNESLIDVFLAELSNDLPKYVAWSSYNWRRWNRPRTWRLPSSRKIAKSIYGQLEQQFVASLPTGCTPKRRACILAIQGLVKENISPIKLADSFFKLITANPTKYLKNVPVRTYAHTLSSFSSSAPEELDRPSGARFATRR